MASCKKFVEIPPPTSEITGVTVYSNNSSAASVMTGLYSNMVVNPGELSSGGASIGSLTGLASDEFTNYDPTTAEYVQFYENALTSSNQSSSNYYFWTELYNEIYVTNAVLEGLAKSTGVTAPVKQQITGEAEFMRAFLHFYATNLYGDVPLVTSTNYQVNNSITRSPQVLVYRQIVADLKDAESKLSPNFVTALGTSTAERTRPNQGAASALLARVYLYTAKYDSAEMEATKLINNSSLYSLNSLNSVFLANSSEAIWQLQPVNPGMNTWDAYAYVLEGVPGPNQWNSFAISSYLLNSFETGDGRLTNWTDTLSGGGITYYCPYKYKIWQYGLPLTEYTMVLRLAEQYLVRAEAKANLGDATAVNDLNVIRNRAGLPNYAGPTDKTSLLAAILHERQVELFSEWGHRWFDLKRTNNINSVMGSPGNVCKAKGGIWNPDWALLPLPLQELQVNSKLTQNPGY
ncbi:MAG TPA: RagB/SusD family nutrient uptake outer membrane protein [Mucilaginibacter sp.]|nr:RagB/SusD family nutrient uptake outer membrane protein [Mucilaginibacter sp.]